MDVTQSLSYTIMLPGRKMTIGSSNFKSALHRGKQVLWKQVMKALCDLEEQKTLLGSAYIR